MKPMISVIIPTLNEASLIQYTLASVRNQDFKGKYEIIVADSNSKDKTVEIAKKYADKVIVTKRKGVSVGRNLGAKAAKGDILLFLDADTILLPNVLSEVHHYFKQHKNIIGLSVPAILDDLQKNMLVLVATYAYRALRKVKLQPIYAVCFACRRNYFFKAGGFSEHLRLAEDIDLGQRLKKLGKIEYLKTTFVISSARRVDQWSRIKQLNAWPLGYFYIKYFKYQQSYPHIRKRKIR